MKNILRFTFITLWLFLGSKNSSADCNWNERIATCSADTQLTHLITPPIKTRDQQQILSWVVNINYRPPKNCAKVEVLVLGATGKQADITYATSSKYIKELHGGGGKINDFQTLEHNKIYIDTGRVKISSNYGDCYIYQDTSIEVGSDNDNFKKDGQANTGASNSGASPQNVGQIDESLDSGNLGSEFIDLDDQSNNKNTEEYLTVNHADSDEFIDLDPHAPVGKENRTNQGEDWHIDEEQLITDENSSGIEEETLEGFIGLDPSSSSKHSDEMIAEQYAVEDKAVDVGYIEIPNDDESSNLTDLEILALEIAGALDDVLATTAHEQGTLQNSSFRNQNLNAEVEKSTKTYRQQAGVIDNKLSSTSASLNQSQHNTNSHVGLNIKNTDIQTVSSKHNAATANSNSKQIGVVSASGGGSFCDKQMREFLEFCHEQPQGYAVNGIDCRTQVLNRFKECKKATEKNAAIHAHNAKIEQNSGYTGSGSNRSGNKSTSGYNNNDLCPDGSRPNIGGRSTRCR